MANHGFGSGWFGGAGGGADGSAGSGPFGMGGPFAMGGIPGAGGFGSAGLGAGGLGAPGMGAGDLDALARQYWSAWGEQLRAAGTPAQPTAPGLNEAIGWWTQLARGGRSENNDVLDRFNTQARGWFAQMHQLSGQFSGKQGSAADVAQAWKQALGENPFAGVLQGMQGPGQQGIEQWFQQVAPFLQSMQQSGKGLLGLPTFGLTREHQQRWQHLAQAQIEQQEHSKAYQALLAEAGKDAFARFEDKLAEHSEPGRQLGTARALFDLWIDAAEEAYAEIALSPKFREVYGKHANAEMRLRAAIQREIEETCGLFGIPGRTEVDGAHRKIAQLERELRRLRDAVELGAQAVAAPRAPSRSPPAASSASAPPMTTRASAESAPAARKSAPARRKPAVAESLVATPAAARRAPVKRSSVQRAAAPSTTTKPAAAKRAAAKPAATKRAATSKQAARKVAAKPTPAKAARAAPRGKASTAVVRRPAAAKRAPVVRPAATPVAAKRSARRNPATKVATKPATRPVTSTATRAKASKRIPATAATRKR